MAVWQFHMSSSSSRLLNVLALYAITGCVCLHAYRFVVVNVQFFLSILELKTMQTQEVAKELLDCDPRMQAEAADQARNGRNASSTPQGGDQSSDFEPWLLHCTYANSPAPARRARQFLNVMFELQLV